MANIYILKMNIDTFEAYSFASSNISKEILEYQKLVFEKFKLPIIQVQENISHGSFLTKTIKQCTAKYIIFFDIDCIPLTNKIYDIILKELEAEKCIIGTEQMCNYNAEKTGIEHIYAAPACLGIPIQLYNELNQPNLECSTIPRYSDTAEELTWACEENNIKVKFFNITNSETKLWKLNNTQSFGYGTTYSYLNQEVLYHQFEIRKMHDLFINKCKQILISL